MTKLVAMVRHPVLLLVFLMAVVPVARAGVDVRLQLELLLLQDIDRQVRSLPENAQSSELRQRILDLQHRLWGLTRLPAQQREREGLLREIYDLERQLDSARKVITNFRETISRGEHTRFFPDVRNRIAVFTFDDPHGIGLGDSVSFLLSKKLLFSRRVSSFAIVNYQQGVDRPAQGGRAYFDQVDAVTQDQGFLLALWGRLSKVQNGVQIETFLQVPADVDQSRYLRTVQLPKAMGGGVLRARLRPDRVLLQRIEIGSDDVAALQETARQVATLRAEPDKAAKVTGTLGEGKDYAREYTVVESRGGWVRLRFRDGGGGWTSVDAFCVGICEKLLDVAAFTNDIVALTAGGARRDVPRSVTREAGAMSDQLAALSSIPTDPNAALGIAARWTAVRSAAPPPGGASFANLSAIATVRRELDRARTKNFDAVRLSRATVQGIAESLAKASVADPGNLEVLENLAVLFGYLGDTTRRQLALSIAESIKARMQ
jgi:hypothetical protein